MSAYEPRPIASFEEAYSGIPPWDIGKPQPAFVELAKQGAIKGTVLDVGCGTGENALYLSGLGHAVMGIDAAPSAIAKAKAKALQRNLGATFLVADALELGSLGRRFDTVIDSGLFHVFSDEQRLRFVKSLAGVLKPGGCYHMMCFSEKEPTEWGGPRRVTQAEIRATFSGPWQVQRIQEAVFETHIHPQGGRAWLASIARQAE